MKDNKQLTISVLIVLAIIFLAFLMFPGCKKETEGGTITVNCSSVTKYTAVTISQNGYAVQIFTSVTETMKSKELPTGNYAVTARYSGSASGAFGGVYQVWAGKATSVILP